MYLQCISNATHAWLPLAWLPLAQTTIVWSVTLFGILLSNMLGRRDRAVTAVDVAGSSNAHSQESAHLSAAVLAEELVDRGWRSPDAGRASMNALSSGKKWLRNSRAESRGEGSSSSCTSVAPPTAVQIEEVEDFIQ